MLAQVAHAVIMSAGEPTTSGSAAIRAVVDGGSRRVRVSTNPAAAALDSPCGGVTHQATPLFAADGAFPARLACMNMGGPNDHWYTDTFTWERPAFGEPTDSLTRDIRRFGGDSLLQDGQPLAQRLWDLWPQWGRVDERALGRLAADLVTIRDELRTDAQARGWEFD